jgi:hypothetical protein
MRTKIIAYWTVTIPIALETLVGGVTDLIHGKQFWWPGPLSPTSWRNYISHLFRVRNGAKNILRFARTIWEPIGPCRCQLCLCITRRMHSGRFGVPALDCKSSLWRFSAESASPACSRRWLRLCVSAHYELQARTKTSRLPRHVFLRFGTFGRKLGRWLELPSIFLASCSAWGFKR